MQNNEHKKLFHGAAWYYTRFRRGYPESFYKHIVNVFNLNDASRALDLGTGTGQIAIPISKILKEVVAIDPDKDMLKEGKIIAKEKGISNIYWANIKAEDISEKLGLFDVTTIGASFHWMKQDKVLEKVYKLSNKGGGVVIVFNTSSFHRNVGNDEWKDVTIKTIEKYLGKKRRAGKGYFDTSKESFEDILGRSKFTVLDTYYEEYKQEWTIEQIIGFLYSTSFAAKWLFGERADEFEEDLKNNLLKINSSGNFEETACLKALIGKKQ